MTSILLLTLYRALTYDTYSMRTRSAAQSSKNGGDSCFFITADVFGPSIERDTGGGEGGRRQG